MSTPIAEIIAQAYRETNLIPVGKTPTQAEETEALNRLRSILKAVIGHEVGEELQNWDVPFVGPNYLGVDPEQPWPNSRLVCRLSAPTTIDLPARPRDGSRIGVQDIEGNFASNNLTLDGNGYNIDGSSTLVLNTNGTNSEWFFRADLGEWKIVTDLDLEDDMPFPEEFDELFMCLLALRLNPRHSSATRPETSTAVQRGINRIRARYRQTQAMPSEIALQLRHREIFDGDNFYLGIIGGGGQ